MRWRQFENTSTLEASDELVQARGRQVGAKGYRPHSALWSVLKVRICAASECADTADTASECRMWLGGMLLAFSPQTSNEVSQ